LIDKVLLLTARSIGGLFSRVKGYFHRYFHRKTGLAIRLGTEGETSAAFFEKSAHCLVESPAKKAFMGTI
jgi:hypothetical protein